MSNESFGDGEAQLCRIVRAAYTVISDEPEPDEVPIIYIQWWIDFSLGPIPSYGPADNEWYDTKREAEEAAKSYGWVIVHDAETKERG